jgi:hypothetical protein
MAAGETKPWIKSAIIRVLLDVPHRAIEKYERNIAWKLKLEGLILGTVW